MKHLKLFEELNPETYASAASKLKKKDMREDLKNYSITQ
jgi:hypothetical protein